MTNVNVRSGKSQAFELHTAERVFQIRAPSTLQCEDWVNAVQRARSMAATRASAGLAPPRTVAVDSDDDDDDDAAQAGKAVENEKEPVTPAASPSPAAWQASMSSSPGQSLPANTYSTSSVDNYLLAPTPGSALGAGRPSYGGPAAVGHGAEAARAPSAGAGRATPLAYGYIAPATATARSPAPGESSSRQPVTSATPAADPRMPLVSLTVVAPEALAGRTYRVLVDGASIGSRDNNTVCMQDSLRSISRAHARILFSAESRCFYVEDLGSANGTYLTVLGTRTRLAKNMPTLVTTGVVLTVGQEVQMSVTCANVEEQSGSAGLAVAPTPGAVTPYHSITALHSVGLGTTTFGAQGHDFTASAAGGVPIIAPPPPLKYDGIE